jgi:hypothetical protein
VTNVLCEHSLINAFVLEQRPVQASLIDEVAREFELDYIAPTVREEEPEPPMASESLLQALQAIVGSLQRGLRQSVSVAAESHERKA